ILLTSWDRDGTRSGYDTELVEMVTAAVDIPVIASGGADNADHLEHALSAGATAVLIASILHDGVTTVGSLKKELLANGTEVRP
ncbi:MAG: HisA/HisF-related TIM barrel protein, partial [Acidimicrobiia bacterium]